VIEFYRDSAKNEQLVRERDISFEEVVYFIEQGHVLDVIEHPNLKKYSKQKLYVLEIYQYVYLVPFLDDEKGRLLKTIFPSRKMT